MRLEVPFGGVVGGVVGILMVIGLVGPVGSGVIVLIIMGVGDIVVAITFRPWRASLKSESPKASLVTLSRSRVVMRLSSLPMPNLIE